MPTGYTAKVADGTISTLEDFALVCAKAFGACATMRDDPPDTPIPAEFVPDPYYKERLDNAIEHYVYLRTLTAEDAERECAAEQALADATTAKAEKARLAENQRYAAMAAKVKAWEPPTLQHEGLKEFMLEQLRISEHLEYKDPSIGVRLAPLEWLAKRIESARKEVFSAGEALVEEKLRVASRNAWLKALRDSLRQKED